MSAQLPLGPPSTRQADGYVGPKPASDAELAAIKLTVDVGVGNTVFRAGTTLLQLVEQHRAIYAAHYQGKTFT